MKYKMTFIVVALGLTIVAACSASSATGDQEVSAPSIETPGTAIITNTTIPEGQDEDWFADVPDPIDATFEYESSDQDQTCRNYASSSPPYTVVQNYAELVVMDQFGWDPEPVFKTGYLYEDSASFSATKGVRKLSVNSTGSGGSSSTMSVCNSEQ